MNILPTLVQIISGAAGGNLVGSGFEKLNLGPIGNSLAGLVGGGIFGQLLQSLIGMGGAEAGSDMQIFLTSVAGGASGGAIMTALVGWVKGLLTRSR